MKLTFAALILYVGLVVPVYAQFCQLFDATLGARITDLRTPTPLTVLYTYTVTSCAVPTTQVFRVTAYPSDGSPFIASPATLTSSGSSKVATATFKFPSLTVTRFAPGEEIYFENFLTNQQNPSPLGTLTVPFNAVTGSVQFSVTSSTPSKTSTASSQTSSSPTSSTATETPSQEALSTSTSSTPSIVAGLIGGVSAIVVLSLLAWVILKSQYFRGASSAGGEKFTKEHSESNTDNPGAV